MLGCKTPCSNNPATPHCCIYVTHDEDAVIYCRCHAYNMLRPADLLSTLATIITLHLLLMHAVVFHVDWLQDTEHVVLQNGGKPPLTMQSFTKLIDKLGDPAAPLPAPLTLPPPGPVMEVTTVPTLQECGFTQQPTTIFRVCAGLLVLI